MIGGVMTNELEKQFFDTFGIEPKHIFRGCKLGAKYYAEICDETTCNGCDEEIRKTEYPTITDRILLELICIRCKELISIIKVKGNNREELKNYILKLCIEDYTFYSKTSEKTYNELANNFKHQVRTLLEEEIFTK